MSPRSHFVSAAILIALISSLARAEDPNVVGAWFPDPNGSPGTPLPLKVSDPNTPYTIGTQGIHAALLPNAHVLVWGTVVNPTDPNDPNHLICDVLLVKPPSLADPNSVVQGVANKLGVLGDDDPNSTHGHDWFCSGTTHMIGSSGAPYLFIMGGGGEQGATSMYEVDMSAPIGSGRIIQGKAEVWGGTSLTVPRWYPTGTQLADRTKVLVTEGNAFDYSPNSNPNYKHCCEAAPDPRTETPMIWTITNRADPNTWTAAGLPGAEYRKDPNDPNAYSFELPTYPFMHLLQTGVFNAGGVETPCDQNFPARYNTTRMLSTSLQTWTAVPTDPNFQSGIPGASSVMFGTRIMKAGGPVTFDAGNCSSYPPATTPTKRAQMIDFNPDIDYMAWYDLPDMELAREWVYLVPLPNGRILASGGGRPEPNDPMW